MHLYISRIYYHSNPFLYQTNPYQKIVKSDYFSNITFFKDPRTILSEVIRSQFDKVADL